MKHCLVLREMPDNCPPQPRNNSDLESAQDILHRQPAGLHPLPLGAQQVRPLEGEHGRSQVNLCHTGAGAKLATA